MRTHECLMNMHPLIPADTQRGAAHETYTCTFAKKDLFDEYGKRYDDYSFQLHKMAIRHYFWKKMMQMLTYFLQIEILQTAVAWIMKEYHGEHNFRF